MDSLVLYPTVTSQWQALVDDASRACHVSLPEEIESYLVFMLMRFVDSPKVAHSVIALEFLDSLLHQLGKQKTESLRDVGDQCLLYSGLFPGRARRRRVRVSYYVKLGKTAYLSLSEQASQGLGQLFSALSEQFVPLMDVLHSMREVHGQFMALDPLQAEEIWSDTGSLHALRTLEQIASHKQIINNTVSSQLRH